MKRFLLPALISLITITMFAQHPNNTSKQYPVVAPEKCMADIIHRHKLETSPAYKARFDKLQEVIRTQPHSQKAGTIYRVPVVVHVMHKGESVGTGTNISEDEIRAGIKLMNQLWRKEAGSKGDGNGVDMEIEFALAVRDPNGDCTNGIVRYDLSGNSLYVSDGVYATSSGIADATLKSYSVWDQTEYYNIWVISEFDNNEGGFGVQGYAYFSTDHGLSHDGAVFLASTFSTATTATHELGHAMNLSHTFAGDCNGGCCPTNTDCTLDGDYICDTPPHVRSGSTCIIGTNSCDGGTSTELYIHNYMDYSSDACQSEFTAGQKVRAQAALTTDRASFLESNGNMALVPPSIATVDFDVSTSAGCVGATIDFTDHSSCIPNSFQNNAWTGITFSWTFDNGVDAPLVSSQQNPSITFANAGTYDVTLEITNSHGTASITKKGAVVINTSPTAVTCVPTTDISGTGNYGIGVYNVTLESINNTTEITDAIYLDYTCTNSTILEPSTTYALSVEGGNTNGQWWKVYIDYNNDGDFADANEEVASNTNITGTWNTSFTTPAAGSITLNTNLRMRVVTDYFASTTPGACTDPLDNGQAEDYGIYITNSIADVSIAASATSISYGTSVTFTATPTNGGASPTYQWYKNGILITGQTSGTYVTSDLLDGDEIYATLYSDLSGVIGSPTNSNTITMSVTGPPLSDFTASTTLICAGNDVTFTDQSLLIPTSWSWTATGGSPASSTSQNPTITYNTAGTYAVSLTASNAHGTGTTETKLNHITVLDAPAMIGSFTARTDGTSGGIGITKTQVGDYLYTSAFDDNYYIDNACPDILELTKDSTYNIAIGVSTFNDQWVRVYIDYDNNGSFNESNNLIFDPANGQVELSGNFTVPSNATLNTGLRMRVISDFINTTPGPNTDPLQFGQIEDYMVMISEGVSGFAAALHSLNLEASTIHDEVWLTWNSVPDQEIRKYVVERSRNGKEFTPVGSVKSQHENPEDIISFVDHLPLEGVNYYRISALTQTNKTVVSEIVQSEVKKNQNVFVAPVPFDQEIMVRFDGFEGDGSYIIRNITGQIVLDGTFDHNNGKGTFNVTTSELSAGTYFITLQNQYIQVTRKIVK